MAVVGLEDKDRSEDDPGARVVLFTKAESMRRRQWYVERHQLPPCKCAVWVPWAVRHPSRGPLAVWVRVGSVVVCRGKCPERAKLPGSGVRRTEEPGPGDARHQR